MDSLLVLFYDIYGCKTQRFKLGVCGRRTDGSVANDFHFDGGAAY